jgi:EpsI family protein
MQTTDTLQTTIDTPPGAKRDWRAFVGWVLLTVGFIGAFGRHLFGLRFHWFPAWGRADLGLYGKLVEGDSYYTHGPLVPIVTLAITYLLLRHTKVPVRPRRALGLLVLVLALLLHVLGVASGEVFVVGLALCGALMGLVLLIWGAGALRRGWFPIVLLLSMVPLPMVTIADLNYSLKMLSAQIGVGIANASGILVEQSGSVLMLQGGKQMVVGNVCSGLRTLISLLTFGALYAYVCRLRGLWRLLLFAMTVPVAIFSNALRIVGLIVVAHVWDVQTATGWFHDSSGVLIFVLAFLMMFGLERLILWVRSAVGKPAQIRGLFAEVRRGPEDAGQGQALRRSARGWAVWCAVGLLAASTCVTWWLLHAKAAPWTGDSLRGSVPDSLIVAKRLLRSTEGTLDINTQTILRTNDYLVRSYFGEDGAADPVELMVVCNGSNGEYLHPPDICLTATGATAVSKGELTVFDANEQEAVPCREIVIQDGPRRTYYLYTYRSSGSYTANYSWVRLLSGILRRLDRNAGGSLIRISTPVDGDVSVARGRCVEFFQAVLPYLTRAIP